LACSSRDVIVLPFIEVGLLKVASYGDDPVMIGHLDLEVSIVRDDHEPGVTWSTLDGMVGAREVRYLEGEHFHAKVSSSSECHGQVDLPKENGLKPRYDSVERSTGWPYHCS
jgi:hypothetical protein